MWIKKKTKISGFSSTEAPDGKDYRTLLYPTFNTIENNNIIQGKPSNLNDYFYLPARGYYLNGLFVTPGLYARYWTSSGEPDNPGGVCEMDLSCSGLVVGTHIGRMFGFCLWSSSNEDMYRPF